MCAKKFRKGHSRLAFPVNHPAFFCFSCALQADINGHFLTSADEDRYNPNILPITAFSGPQSASFLLN
jgi:hypothetical protein